MKALLLAAGLGTRLRPITDRIPKCLVPIHGKPLLGYWLDMLLSSGIERVLINTHYLPDPVREFVASSPWSELVDLIHEDELLGTGGTVLRNSEYLSGGPFLLAHADNLTRFNVMDFIDSHMRHRSEVEISMMTFDTDVPQSCGIVELDSNSIVRQFHEKVANPPGVRANAAVYIFEPSIFAYLESLKKETIDISTEVLPKYLGRIGTFHNTWYHRDIGSPESLRQAEIEFPKI